MKNESQEGLSRVLDEIAEVTRNNNVMNATETNNPNNFKIFEPVALSIKSENDRYLLENTDEENLFDCQVELTEETDSFIETENAKPYKESDQLIEEQSSELPKIHLKTVDEINRKCIVSNYIDIAKRRRQEVNRRYYLKKKQQQMVEKKFENQTENEIPTFTNNKVENFEEPKLEISHNFQLEEKEQNDESQNYNFVQYQNYTYPPEYEQVFQPSWTQESYESHSKKIRQEINRRYYLKRKKKRQEEEGIEEKVIVKNEAYFRRRERNRRYYLKKKQKEKGDEVGDDSSNSSLQFNYSIPYEDKTEILGLQFSDQFQGTSEHSDYTCMSNEMGQEIKIESNSSVTYVDGYNQAVQGWIDSQTTYQDYENEERSYEQSQFVNPDSTLTKQSLEEYLNEAARKRQERNRRYYLKHKDKLKQQRLQKGKHESVKIELKTTNQTN